MKKLQKKEVKSVHHHIKRAGKKEHYNLFFRYKYKKLTILLLAIIAAYLLFSKINISAIIPSGQAQFISLFVAGILLAFGFLAPFAAGFFITLNPESIITAALIAGIGTVIADLFIFRFIRISFMSEFDKLKKSPVIKDLNNAINISFLHRIKLYIYYSIIGIIIASPLPDEIGISMLAGLTKIKTPALAIISYILHFIGILILLSI